MNVTKLLFVVLLAICIAAPLFVRVFLEARTADSHATQHEANGNLILAIPAYREMMRWHYPLSPYFAKGKAALEQLSNDNEQPEEIRLAAQKALVGGLSASRNILQTEPPPDPTPSSAIQEQVDFLFSPRLNLLSWVLFLSWIAMVIRIIQKCFTAEGDFLKKNFTPYALSFALLYSSWLWVLFIA